jgi:hypothetical protein
MPIGPVDVYIVGFPGNKFSGEIVPAIMDLVQAGTIRVLDVLFVMKDADGVVASLSIEDLDPDLGPAFLELEVSDRGVLNEEDAEEISEDLAPNSSALLIAYENTWMAPLVSAMMNADAVVIDQIRIPADVVMAALTA